MEYRCSACHTAFEADPAPHACPTCRAEAGLEPKLAVPLPMKLFGVLVGSVLLSSVAGGVIGLFAGS